LEEVGTLDVEFETSWDTLETDDLSREGTLDMALTWEGYELEFVREGAGAGYSEDTPLVAFIGLMDPFGSEYVLPYVYFDEAQVDAGVSLSVGDEVGGVVLYTNEDYEGALVEAGWLYGGTIEFDEFDTTDDAVVSGSMSTMIYSWTE
ncbi:MAG: hypothetical protein QGG40_17260, partial [Myxococcota bacterium]|nr:hypothetical protein [Myxococcota bacterium]